MKDQINSIYNIPCNGKNGEKCTKSYVGQSKNQLKKRLNQHERDVLNAEKKTPAQTATQTPAVDDCTALVTHTRETKHSPDFDNVSILEREQYLSRRLLMESLQICCHDTMNKRRDIENISQTYASILKQVKESINKKSHRTHNSTSLNTHTHIQT